MKINRTATLIVVVTILMFSSCATTTYIGDILPVTKNVDIYYAEKDVKKEYKVIGHITAPTNGDENAAKPRIIERGKKVGADAVILLGRGFTGGKDSESFEKADAIKYLK
ncbi:hypothetical protein [Mucilaginibacter polytrichastri]|nr:hypothetical protein [Mucilaginibacter polytrichastri]